MGTFLGGLGGVETSPESPLSIPKMEGEYGELGPECSVLNLSIFLLGLNGDPMFPAGEEKEPKSAPKSSDRNNLMYASFPPPSFPGDAFSTSPNACSRDDDLQGMNLSLQFADFDDGEDDRFESVLGDIDIGDGKFVLDRSDDPLGVEKVSSRREVSFIVDGRLIPLFLLGGVESISSLFFFFF